jgi:DNA-binding transcriptional LysR family regulator
MQEQLSRSKNRSFPYAHSLKGNSMPAIVEAAIQDMGFVLLSAIASEPLVQTGQCVRILGGHCGKQWPFHFVHPFQGEKPIHMTRFHQLIHHFFEKTNTGEPGSISPFLLAKPHA